MHHYLLSVFLLSSLALAQTFDVTPTWNSNNHGRVFIGGGGNLAWISFDDGTATSGSRQQWQWLNFSTELNDLPEGLDVVSATLSWSGQENDSNSNDEVRWGVFAPEGSDRGRAAVRGIFRSGGDVPFYYARNVSYGAVTTGEIAGSSQQNPVTWDVTALVKGWYDGTISSNVGQMIILNDRNSFFGPPNGGGHGDTRDWINWDNQGPSLQVTLNGNTPRAPTDILASPANVIAGSPAGTVAGVLTAVDVNVSETHTYSLVSGDGDTHNDLFTINGDNELILQAAASTLETTYSVRLRVTDKDSLSFERSIEVGVSLYPFAISEFLTQNDGGLRDENDETPDWIEIRNLTARPQSLTGWSLTDDALQTRKWNFPDVTVAPAANLIVFASGKNLTPTDGSPLHTNFSLARGGEYLALVAPGAEALKATVFSPQYPAQRANVSYSKQGYHAEPTPGDTNGQAFLGVVQDTSFSMDRGFYDAPFTTVISTSTPEATIVYTTDGSAPTLTNGQSTPGSNSASLTISETTTLRAAAFRDGYVSTNVDTHTFIFRENLLTQTRPSGHPTGVDFRMDSDVTTDPDYADILPNSFLNAPSVSMVMDFEDIFGDQGIYTNPTSEGPDWERASSIEWIDPINNETFQVNSGVRLQGAGSRTQSPKRNFRIRFTSDFGPTKLDFKLFEDSEVNRFDNLVLRNATHDSWTVSQDSWRSNARYVNDDWAVETQFLMGHLAPHRRWVHLYINGLYWGIYTLTERPDADFASSYLGGDSNEYDTVNAGRARDGDLVAWEKAHDIARGDDPIGEITTREAYEELERYLDYDSLIDYFLYNLYMMNIDWPNKNFWAVRKREENGQYRFVNWDAETGFFEEWPHPRNVENLNALDFDLLLSVNRDNIGSGHFYRRLKNNEEFRIRFADRVHLHLKNGGLLSTEEARLRYENMITRIAPLLVPESARWGDSQQRNPLTPNDEWATLTSITNWVFTDFFPQRADDLIEDLRRDRSYPNHDPPIFAMHGGIITSGQNIAITNPNSTGIIYFTTDGSDPREAWTGLPVGQSYSAPVVMNRSITLKARVLQGDEWSALTQAQFITDEPATAANLVISEIHYHPETPTAQEMALGFGDQDDFEFIELSNISQTPISLSGVRFVEGVEFLFPSDFILGVGERTLVVKNVDAFRHRNPGVPASRIAGIFFSPTGIVNNEQLDNGGETLVLQGADGAEIARFTYNDKAPWPESADGDGYSIVYRGGSQDPALAQSWRSSVEKGGNPDATDSLLFTGGDLLAYTLADPNLQLAFDSQGRVEITYIQRLSADDALLTLQKSAVLSGWDDVGSEFEVRDRINLGDGTAEVRWRSLIPQQQELHFYRLNISQR